METNKADITSVLTNHEKAKGSPIKVLGQLCHDRATGRLILTDGQVTWVVRLEAGMVTYASNSVEPFDRLSCHLRHLSHDLPTLTKEFRAQVCQMFEDATDPSEEDTGTFAEEQSFRASDYAALCWLVNQQHLTYAQASKLVEGMLKEAIEPLFWLDEVNCSFTKSIGNPLTLCKLEFSTVAAHCLQKLKSWQMLAPQVWSPYQRPYFFGQPEGQKNLLPENVQQKFSNILKGYSFRHLAVLLNKEELRLTVSLMPYIRDEIVVLKEPESPFDLLPKVPSVIPAAFQKFASQNAPSTSELVERNIDSGGDTTIGNIALESADVNKTVYKIACVDDSPTVLTEIGRFLHDDNFQVFAINDPLKGMVQMLKIKPDIVLLDVTMPKVNGYDLCKMLRNSPALKKVPIIMVTGNTGLIDRAKAKISGATDYLTKPFTQEGLLKMIFRYLS